MTDQDAGTKDPDPLRVAGIGGSPGWPVIEAVLAQLPARPGLAVIALADDDEPVEHVVDRLRGQVSIAVVAARDGEEVDSDVAYIVPRGVDAVLQHGRLRLFPPSHGTRAPLDRLLRSLADELGRDAAGIVVAGEGVDGSLGVKRIKEAGGITIVQAPDEARPEAMPRAAIATGVIDLVLRRGDIARRLVDLARATTEPVAVEDGRSPDLAANEALRDILTLVRIRSGHGFTFYKRQTLLRRIARRMQLAQTQTISEYLKYLREHQSELGGLLRDFLISVTNFFRDADAFEALNTLVVPLLFHNKGHGDQVRVWVAGCATGEEAYSLGILLGEHAATLDEPPAVQIFATDIDEDALAEARAGRYPDTISVDVSPSRLERFFMKDGSYYKVRKELREMILFSPHNVLRDPPFSKLDLITCRNLLIYLNRDAQDRVLNIFHFGLRSDGHLFLGSSESGETPQTQFSPVDGKHRIYARRPAVSSLQVDTILPTGRWQLTATPALDSVHERIPVVGELHHRLVELYAPPSVVVNDELDIIHLSEHAGKYLVLAGGEPTRQLLRLAHPALRLDLRAAVYAARQPDAGADKRVARFTDDDGTERFVEISIQTVELKDEGSRSLLLVMFDEQDPAEAPARAQAARAASDPSIEPVVRQLEEELHRTRDHLRSTVEQYETSLEELKASNEELHAINEELRSATEELETSKEELQSVNEELTTLNHELKVKVDEISRANSDLSNLMASTDIAVVFLDRELRIKRFTERAKDLFNMIASDLGRPLSDLTHRLDVDDLSASAAHVLATLRTVERELTSRDGRRYLTRLLPYRSIDDRIEGVVLTFFNITELERVKTELRAREELLRGAERREHELLGEIADQLRGPLAPMRSAVEAREHGAIDREAIKLTQLVDDLTDGSRLAEGSIALRADRFTLGELVDTAVRVARQRVAHDGHTIELAIHDPAFELTADLGRMQQALGGLLASALETPPAGGSIAIVTAVEGDTFVIRVRGGPVNGDGDAAPIGLRLARQVVERYGGRAETRDGTQSDGREVSLRLPMRAIKP